MLPWSKGEGIERGERSRDLCLLFESHTYDVKNTNSSSRFALLRHVCYIHPKYRYSIGGQSKYFGKFVMGSYTNNSQSGDFFSNSDTRLKYSPKFEVNVSLQFVWCQKNNRRSTLTICFVTTKKIVRPNNKM